MSVIPLPSEAKNAESLTMCIRLRPPASSDAYADYLFSLEIFGDKYPAFAYAMHGPSADNRMAWRKRVGESRASISLMYECMRSVAASVENDDANPLHFIQTRGKSEWLQQLIFVTVCERELLNCNERFLYHLPVVNSRSTSAALREPPGSLVVCSLKFGVPQSALRDCVSLASLLKRKPLIGEPSVFIVCPLAIVPSGARQFNLSHSAPTPQRVERPMHVVPGSAERLAQLSPPRKRKRHEEANSYLPVPFFMQLCKREAATSYDRDYARDTLFPYWYGQYLVSGFSSSFIDVWPGGGSGGSLRSFGDRDKTSLIPSCVRRAPVMRDGEPVPYSLDAVHCLLAGMVRFHCERVALLSADRSGAVRFGSSMDASGELIVECLYTPTVKHPKMSFRDLMRTDGFAALCRQVHRSLLMYSGFNSKGHAAPRVRRRAEWFRETLGCIVSMVLQCENTRVSEQETLRLLQYNGLCEYPLVPADEERYALRQEVVSDAKLPRCVNATLAEVRRARYGARTEAKYDAARKYLIRVRAAGSAEHDADTLAYYRDVLPAAECAADFKWIFEMDFQHYMEASHRGCADFGQRRQVVVRCGVVQLVWLHLVGMVDPQRPSDAPFDVQGARRPWLADFFVHMISAASSKKRGPRGDYDKHLTLDGDISTMLDDSHCARITHYIVGERAEEEEEEAANSEESSSGGEFDDSEATKRMSDTVSSRALTDCLPVAQGVFLPHRGAYLRDAPLSGRRHKQYVSCGGGADVRALVAGKSGERDFVSMFGLEADADQVKWLAASAGYGQDEGDECVIYNAQTRSYEKMNIAKCVSRAPPSRRIEDRGDVAARDPIEMLRERGALPPCMLDMERQLENGAQDFKNGTRTDYALSHISNKGVVDIEDIVGHVVRVEESMPNRAGKVDKHVAAVRGFGSRYDKQMRRNVEYMEGKYGRARNTAGSMSCAQVESRKAALSIGSTMRCPYAEYAARRTSDAELDASLKGVLRDGVALSAERRAALRAGTLSPKLLCSQVASGNVNTPLTIKYPRDYIRLVLHTENKILSDS